MWARASGRRSGSWAAAMGLLVGLTGVGCQKDESPATREEAKADAGQPETAKGEEYALPQEELARKKNSIKVKGSLIVEGYTEGLLQIDVFRDEEGNQKPLTNARFKSPGPYEMYLPPTVSKVVLVAVLDLKSDGPGREDPKGEYSGNPLEVTGTELTGIDISIDKSNVREPPPDRAENQDKPVDIDEDDAPGEAVIGPDGTTKAAGTPAPAAGAAPAGAAPAPAAAPAGAAPAPAAAPAGAAPTRP